MGTVVVSAVGTVSKVIVSTVSTDNEHCNYRYTSEPVVQTSAEPVKMYSCLECSFKSRSGFPINMEQTLYRNYQKMTLQVI